MKDSMVPLLLREISMGWLDNLKSEFGRLDRDGWAEARPVIEGYLTRRGKP